MRTFWNQSVQTVAISTAGFLKNDNHSLIRLKPCNVLVVMHSVNPRAKMFYVTLPSMTQDLAQDIVRVHLP